MRDPEIQTFLDALDAGFRAGEPAGEQAAFIDRLHTRLALAGRPQTPSVLALPATAHLPDALRRASAVPAVNATAVALGILASRLPWRRRAAGGPHASASFQDGHANAVILGQGGIEERADVMVGVSLLAPEVRYPDHDHPPEELYLVLTEGRFQHGDATWVQLGPGDRFHNPPGICHAMASGAGPLLAVWALVA